MKIVRERSHLVIVDIQVKLADTVIDPDRLIDRVIFLVTVAKRLGVPVTITEQYPRGLGSTVTAIREAAGSEAVVLDKVQFSCLDNEQIAKRFDDLRGQMRDHVVVVGMEAHVCIMQTALDLASAHFHTFVVADAISSRAASSRDLAISRLRDEGCTMVDAEMVMFEWLRQAGTPEFKELQNLIKP